jgi:hypothetical protein
MDVSYCHAAFGTRVLLSTLEETYGE